ncbi:putative Cyclin-dependent kinase 2 [Blattamonas nauphoetae]|uniref:Cyclin-dependent kinase 2 n=1 Tax=Blattamonas nauphoetae TaxID=2049346 RepID=A0ABQ9XFY2_9EUKA|nr:putative Cyclin-dependent kinase 2 [Blattamonas nauphoetae]
MQNDSLQESYLPPLPESYVRVNYLGSGGFGSVYQAKHNITGEMFAIKVITYTNEMGCKKNEREITKLKKFQHPNVVRLVEVKKKPQSHHIVLELCTCSLAHQMRESSSKGANLDRSTIFRYMCDILEGLAFLHQNKQAFGDLKPSNILISRDGVAKLGDFGGVTSVGTGQQSTAKEKGTYQDWAPEFFTRSTPQPSMKGDMWAFGMILLEMVTRPGWITGSDASDFAQSVCGFDVSTAIKSLPEPLQRLLASLLNPNPKERWSSSRLLQSEKLLALINSSDSIFPMDPMRLRRIQLDFQNHQQLIRTRAPTTIVQTLSPQQQDVQAHDRYLIESSNYTNVRFLDQDHLGRVYRAVYTLPPIEYRIRIVDDPNEASRLYQLEKTIEQFCSCSSFLILTRRVHMCRNTQQTLFVFDDSDQNTLDYGDQTSQRPKALEDVVRKVIFMIAHGITDLHKAGFLHRFLVPANVCFRCDGECATVRALVSNFSRACPIADRQSFPLRSEGLPFKTCLYMAPEILDGLEYGESIDAWSLGCIALELLLGHQPFASKDINELREEVPSIPTFIDDLAAPAAGLTDDCISFLKGVLDLNQMSRLSFSNNALLSHRWFAGLSPSNCDLTWDDFQTLAPTDIPQPQTSVFDPLSVEHEQSTVQHDEAIPAEDDQRPNLNSSVYLDLRGNHSEVYARRIAGESQSIHDTVQHHLDAVERDF